MNVTISLQTLLIAILIIAATIVLILLAILIAKLFPTIRKVNDVLDDAKQVSAFAAKETGKADGIITGMGDSVSAIASNLKANKNTIKNLSSLVGAATSIIGVAKATGAAGAKKEAKAKKETK
jgi:predicted PurR-regulated permease PerM